MSNKIEIIGASTNNLKSVDAIFPLRKATMVVGVSGSGKSSLLADTLAIEANVRMRRFLNVHQPHLDEADVPAFIGSLPPCLHFSQNAFRASRRTTVATSSGLLSLIRQYFRRYSKPWAEEVKDFVPNPSASNYGEWIQNHYTGSVSIWSVLERWERTDGTRAINSLSKYGLKRAVVRSETDRGVYKDKGREIDLDSFRPLSKTVKHLIEAEIGHVNINAKKVSNELFSCLQKAFDIGGDVIVEFHQKTNLPEELNSERGLLLDSIQHWVHPKVKLPFAPPSNALLSFNYPSNPRSGACRLCQGLGKVRTVSIEALVNRPELSLHEGALSLWTKKNYRYVNIQHEAIEGLRGLCDFDPNIPWRSLSNKAQQLILNGSGKETVADVDLQTKRKISSPRSFPGFIPAVLRRAEGSSASARSLEELTTEGQCPECNGTRWSREARALRLGEWSLSLLLGLTFDELKKITDKTAHLEDNLAGVQSLAESLRTASEAFISAGLGHLSGERGMTTLSEGESRRSRLAALLRAGGYGLGLLLDEPARGLHEEDVARLVEALVGLKRRHTLIINEHRLSLSRAADYVIEIGPGAGEEGGTIVNSGSPQQVFTPDWHPHIERLQIPISQEDKSLVITGAAIHTLKNITCRIPIGRLTSITGVSGSGKSSFVRGILLPALTKALITGSVESEEFSMTDGLWESITGAENISSVLALEPRTPTAQRRSTVATLLDLAEEVRLIFGKLKDSSKANLTAKDFGLNAGEGRCQTCLGLGEIKDESEWIPCPHCGGKCFGEEVLGIRVESLNVAELFEIPISKLINHPFVSLTEWQPLLDQLITLDLGYLTLGRRVDRLSGGEHQRLRIARKLAGKRSEGLLLVLDEPSAGLHPRDVAKLLKVLDRIVDGGRNTVVLVEHNLDLVRASDWIIDFGPGGGPAGGKIVGEGIPGNIAAKNTPTGRALTSEKLYSMSNDTQNEEKVAVSVKTEESARSGRQWLKRLIGEEISSEENDPVDFEGLGIIFENDVAARPYEIAGLDVEIARLLLDESNDFIKDQQNLAKLWSENSGAYLRINPLIEELRIWGNNIPLSVLKAVETRLKKLGIENTLTVQNYNTPAEIRITGKRFQAATESTEEKSHRINDALGIGGGYVELFDEIKGVLGTVVKRKLDLSVPAVAPLSVTSASLVRSHTTGRCPCCRGVGLVPVFDENLIIADQMKDPTKEEFLHPEAFKILRGIRRNLMLPFFKKMIEEGLWVVNRPFNQLQSNERTILMNGYWHRPGHGSFLKSPKSDPEEVNSWLRWSGLYRTVLDEANKSKSKEWINKIRQSTNSVECPICSGTGLNRYSRAVYIGEQSFFDLVRKGTVGDMIKALEEFVPSSARSKKRRERILDSMKPLKISASDTSLRKPIRDVALQRTVFERTVKNMTTLEVAE